VSLQTFLRESIWGYPIISAIHVLGIAWFGGTILVSHFGQDLRKLRQLGVILLLTTGTILFWLQPAQYYTSVSFSVKMVLVVVVLVTRAEGMRALVLWAAIIFASRGIAFW
jgi:hypothetical protein